MPTHETPAHPQRQLFFLAENFFEGQPVSAFGVAFFATRHQIAFNGFAPTNDRHKMIHSQNCRRVFAAAMMADADGSLALPPLAGAQLSSFSPLTPDSFFAHRHEKRDRFHTANYLYNRLIFRR